MTDTTHDPVAERLAEIAEDVAAADGGTWNSGTVNKAARERLSAAAPDLLAFAHDVLGITQGQEENGPWVLETPGHSRQLSRSAMRSFADQIRDAAARHLGGQQ